MSDDKTEEQKHQPNQQQWSTRPQKGTDDFPAALLRLATAMEQLWLAGNVAEGRRWIDQALRLSPAPSCERARALHAAGWLADIQQDHAKARALVAESLALSSRLGDDVGEAWAWLTLGLVELTAENLDVAKLHLERSRELHQALDDRLGTCRSLMNLAVVKTLTPTAREQGRRDLRRARARGPDRGSLGRGLRDDVPRPRRYRHRCPR